MLGCTLHVGPEIGVASTKAFTGQICVLTMMALMIAKEKKTLEDQVINEYLQSLEAIPSAITAVLEQTDVIHNISKTFRYASNFLYLGRGFNFPVALEGALKLKEISTFTQKASQAAEMKHGPLALSTLHACRDDCPCSDPTYEKTKANIKEVLAEGSVIAITEEGNHELDAECEHVIYTPKVPECMQPLSPSYPFSSQLLHRTFEVARSTNRNLAKSVTVE